MLQLLLLQLVVTTANSDSGGGGQYFIREPEDVTASLGDDNVVFVCQVGGQSVGLRQWTRNGFGLGTDPTLPGFPRYSLGPDNSLHINAVAEADAGEYQCQVGAGGDGSPPMRSRSARLTVRVPPGPPRIFSDQQLAEESNNKGIGEEMVVINVREGETAILECESAGGRPAAQLDWWQDEVGRLPSQLEAITTRNVVGTTDDDRQPGTGAGGGATRTLSSLRLRISRAEHHNRRLLCAASVVPISAAAAAVAAAAVVVALPVLCD